MNCMLTVFNYCNEFASRSPPLARHTSSTSAPAIVGATLAASGTTTRRWRRGEVDVLAVVHYEFLVIRNLTPILNYQHCSSSTLLDFDYVSIKNQNKLILRSQFGHFAQLKCIILLYH